jgi:hypothetical protein
MGFDTIYLLKGSKSLQLSLDGLSSHFLPRGRKLREVQLQLWVLYTFRKAGTLGSPLQVFARIFAHGSDLMIIRLRRSRRFARQFLGRRLSTCPRLGLAHLRRQPGLKSKPAATRHGSAPPGKRMTGMSAARRVFFRIAVNEASGTGADPSIP